MSIEDEHSNNADREDIQSSAEENEESKEQPRYFLETEKPLAEAGASERKRELMRVLISFGILLIYGVLLFYLVPYTKYLASRTFQIAPTFILQEFLLPLFWIQLGWTVAQALGVVGLVGKRQSKAGRAIHISAIALIALYFAVLLPFFIELIKVVILSNQYLKRTGSFSYTYQIPLFFKKLAYGLISFSPKSGIFAVFGIILWLSKPEKRKRQS